MPSNFSGATVPSDDITTAKATVQDDDLMTTTIIDSFLRNEAQNFIMAKRMLLSGKETVRSLEPARRGDMHTGSNQGLVWRWWSSGIATEL